MKKFSVKKCMEIKKDYLYDCEIARVFPNRAYFVFQNPGLKSPYPYYFESVEVDFDYAKRVFDNL